MRYSQAYLIIRFLTWPVTWLVLAGMLALGWIAPLFESSGPKDIVCWGQVDYDLNNKRDLRKLREDMFERPTGPDAFQRPPCDLMGHRLPKATIDKIYANLTPKS